MKAELRDLGVCEVAEECLLCMLTDDVQANPSLLLKSLVFIWRTGALGEDLGVCRAHVEFIGASLDAIEKQIEGFAN